MIPATLLFLCLKASANNQVPRTHRCSFPATCRLLFPHGPRDDCRKDALRPHCRQFRFRPLSSPTHRQPPSPGSGGTGSLLPSRASSFVSLVDTANRRTRKFNSTPLQFGSDRSRRSMQSIMQRQKRCLCSFAFTGTFPMDLVGLQAKRSIAEPHPAFLRWVRQASPPCVFGKSLRSK